MLDRVDQSASSSTLPQAEVEVDQASESNQLNQALAILGSESESEVQPAVLDSEPSEPLLYRSFELLAAVVGLVVLSPLLAAIAAVLAFQRQGSVLYTQIRVGRGGKPFTIYKFRTMRLDAEENGPFICTSYDDPRITKVGHFLRKTKLDELPQLWNVFLGDMSFVGPRPERPHFHEKFLGIPNWERRILVKPGLTGLAQASKWISHDPEEKLSADLVYLEKRSFPLDMKIVFYTLLPSKRPKTLHDVPMG